LKRHNRGARWAGAQEDSFLKTIVDAVPGAVAYWDLDLICRFANQACMQWFGKSPETVIGTHYRYFVNEEFFRPISDIFERRWPATDSASSGSGPDRTGRYGMN
jgi:PAS domain-containing protein